MKMKRRTPVYITLAIILVLLFIVFYMFVQSSSFLASPIFWGVVVIAAIVTFIQNALGDLVEDAKFKLMTPEEKQEYLHVKTLPYFRGLYDSAFKKQSATEEKDLLIDHGFDGIMELDNQLPKWWLGLFWFGVCYCAVYILSYAFTDYAHQLSEYDAEYKQQLADVAAFEASQPQVTIETAQYSPDNIAEGEQLFKTNCVSCHGEGGRGGIGPNLTDNYWINMPEKTLFKNVFHMDWNGSPNNPAMRAFGANGEVSGKEIEKIAAYVYHINQEMEPITPAQGGAAPQGEEAHWEK